MAELTEKQKRFADYYIESGNATESYKRAGYSATNENIAAVEASKLLRNPKVKQYMDAIIEKKDDNRIAKQDEVLEFLTNVLRGKVAEQFPIGLGMGEQQLVKKELDGKDRIKAAELLGKRYTLWTDKHQLEGTLGVSIVDDIK